MLSWITSPLSVPKHSPPVHVIVDVSPESESVVFVDVPSRPESVVPVEVEYPCEPCEISEREFAAYALVAHIVPTNIITNSVVKLLLCMASSPFSLACVLSLRTELYGNVSPSLSQCPVELL